MQQEQQHMWLVAGHNCWCFLMMLLQQFSSGSSRSSSNNNNKYIISQALCRNLMPSTFSPHWLPMALSSTPISESLWLNYFWVAPETAPSYLHNFVPSCCHVHHIFFFRRVNTKRSSSIISISILQRHLNFPVPKRIFWKYTRKIWVIFNHFSYSKSKLYS